MHYEVNLKDLTICQVFTKAEYDAMRKNPLTGELAARRIYTQHTDLYDLLAFFCPAEWQKEDYLKLRMTRLSQLPHSEGVWLTAKEFAAMYNYTREYVYQLADRGDIKVKIKNKKKYFKQKD